MKNEKVEKESKDLMLENAEQIKKLFPEVVSEGKINLEKLTLILAGGGVLENKEESYTFNWAGRKDTFRNIQSTSKATLAPSEKSVNPTQTENLFIEGDNLEVLKLLQKSYFNQIKMIYIDPPYNTGHDFVYKDDFKNSIKAYLEQTGQIKDGQLLTTNPETNGRFHSDWISMIYSRLFLARNLLNEKGVMFVSIDDNEVHNLKRIMNEIFGEENVEQIIWKKAHERYGKMKNTQTVRIEHDYILIGYKSEQRLNKINIKPQFAHQKPKREGNREFYVGYIARGQDGSNSESENYYEVISPQGKKIKAEFEVSKDEFERLDKENRIHWTENNPYKKIYTDETQEVRMPSILSRFGTTYEAKKEFLELFPESGELVSSINPKPVELIKVLLDAGSNKDSIILDFFAGSGTTAQAVIEQNITDGGRRKFILVQLPEKIDEGSEAYTQGYRTIADIAKERIIRVINKTQKEQKAKLIKNDLGLGFKIFQLEKSNYKIWENYEGQDVKELTKQLDLFKSPLINNYNDLDVIYECIVKEGLNLNAVVEPKKLNGNNIFRVSDGIQSFYICLDEKIKQENLDKLDLKRDELFICLDKSLDDSKKVNLRLQCKLKTI